MRTTLNMTLAPLAAVALLAACDLVPPSAARPASDASALTACTRCHGGDQGDTSGAPPTDAHGQRATTALGVGAHQVHLGAKLSAKVACDACHVVPSSADDGHVDGDAKVSFGVRAFSDLFAGAQWRPDEASCTVYCHGATYAGGRFTAPVWTRVDGTQAACDACHGAPPPAPHPAIADCGGCHDGYTASTVNVATHVDGEVQALPTSCTLCHGHPPAAPHPTSDQCATCHGGTVNADGSLVPGGLHMNGTVEATGNHPASWADKAQHGYAVNESGLASCKDCHGPDLAGGTSGVSCASCHSKAGVASWDTSCTFCHGNRSTGRQSPPLDTQGGSARTSTSVGAHDKHVAPTMTAAIACGECHPARTASVITDAAHIDGDGVAEVTFGSLSKTGGAAATYNRTSPTAATCSSVYCHGKFTGGSSATPSWVSATAMTCTSCHGNPPSTGEHSKHKGQGLTCYNCHNTVANSSGAISNPALHVNGAKNVTFGGTWNDSGRNVTVTGTFSGTSCSGLNSACHGGESW